MLALWTCYLYIFTDKIYNLFVLSETICPLRMTEQLCTPHPTYRPTYTHKHYEDIMTLHGMRCVTIRLLTINKLYFHVSGHRCQNNRVRTNYSKRQNYSERQNCFVEHCRWRWTQLTLHIILALQWLYNSKRTVSTFNRRAMLKIRRTESNAVYLVFGWDMFASSR